MLASPATSCCAARDAPHRAARRAPLRRCSAARVVSATASAAPPSPVVILPGLGNAAEDYVALSAALEAQLGAVVRTAQARRQRECCTVAAAERRPRLRRCLARTGCATWRAWSTRPIGAASCAPRRRWTGAADARPWRARARADTRRPRRPARYLERMTAAVADARAASGKRRVSLVVWCRRCAAALASRFEAHDARRAGAQRWRLARARVAAAKRCARSAARLAKHSSCEDIGSA